MKANEYRILVQAVEDGVRGGIMRAYKHEGDYHPPTASQEDVIIDYVINSICEWFAFEDIHGDV